MKIVLISDLHGALDIDIEPNPHSYLVLCGDIDEAKREHRLKPFLEKCCGAYKKVLYIPGNHEYYGSSIGKIDTLLQKYSTELPNLIVLQNSMYYSEEDAVLFIGATLWSSMDNKNPVTMYDAGIGMNDYKHIRFGTKAEPWKTKLKPFNTVMLHDRTVQYFTESIKEHKELHPDSKIVVCTHHAPHPLSIDPRYTNDKLNGAYCSNLDLLIEELEPNLWLHGHIHKSFDYTVHKTRIVCNPYGYHHPGHIQENGNYNFNKIIEV